MEKRGATNFHARQNKHWRRYRNAPEFPKKEWPPGTEGPRGREALGYASGHVGHVTRFEDRATLVGCSEVFDDPSNAVAESDKVIANNTNQPSNLEKQNTPAQGEAGVYRSPRGGSNNLSDVKGHIEYPGSV